MIESKPWKWNKLNEKGQKQWKEPCIESYYLINRWKKQKKRFFRHRMWIRETYYSICQKWI